MHVCVCACLSVLRTTAENYSRWCLVVVGQRKKGVSLLRFVLLALQPFPPSGCIDSLWLQVAPSHPSLQAQRKESPCTMHVPPFSQGFGRQLLFRAATHKHHRRRRREELPPHPTWLGVSSHHYYVADAAFASSASTEFTSTIKRKQKRNPTGRN